MSDRAIRVLLRSQTRWKDVLLEQLPAVGVRAADYVGPRTALRRLRLGALWRLWRSRIVHQIYISRQPSQHALFRSAHKSGTRVVAHWIGSDVVELREFVTANGQAPAELQTCVDVHLADSPEIRQELTEFGIDSQVIRLIPSSVEADVMPLPETPGVLSYWPDARAAFYRCDMFMDLARRFPDVAFYVAGATGESLTDVPANVTFLGNVRDMDGVYRKVTAFVRIVEHDSLSAMALEALARGRYVLYNHSFLPHTQIVSDLADASAALSEVLAAPSPNAAGAEHVRENFSWRNEVRKLKGIYEEALSG